MTLNTKIRELLLLLAIGASLTTGLFALAPTALAASGLKPGATIYGVVPPLFGRQPLRSVTAKLDYLADLGVDVLWLSVMNESDDDSLISYAITDHKKIRPDFGTEEDLKDLVQKAHARGLKVIMDTVPNHTSAGHPYFEEAKEFGKSSPFYDYYEWQDGKPSFYYDWDTLPNLNLRHAPAVRMIVDSFRYWITEFGVDGYRMDVAWGPRKRAPRFWTNAVEELRSLEPNLVLLAEASARDPYYHANGFDLAYDWKEGAGEWAWKEVFSRRAGLAERLHRALVSGQYSQEYTARFLNNNDTGKRFVTRYGAPWTRVAAVLQFTLPGTPVLYTGDEVGAAYDPYEDPSPISFRDRHGLRPLYRKLTALREALPSLHSGEWLPLTMDRSGAAYAYLRRHGSEQTLVALNFGPAREVELELPAGYAWGGPEFTDALSGKALRPQPSADGKKLKLKLAKESALVLVPRSAQKSL